MFVLLHLAQSLSHAFTTSSNVLSRYCFQCPNVTADCFLPRCVSAAGIARPIKVVDKMLSVRRSKCVKATRSSSTLRTCSTRSRWRAFTLRRLSRSQRCGCRSRHVRSWSPCDRDQRLESDLHRQVHHVWTRSRTSVDTPRTLTWNSARAIN